MKKLYPLVSILIFLVLNSCSDDERIQDNIRLRFTGRLVDTEGLPVSDMEVFSRTEKTELGGVLTDATGNFQFNSLNVARSSVLLTINDSRYGAETNPEFGSIRFLEVRSGDQRNVDFDEITIAKRANFRLVTIPQTGTTDTLTYQVSFTSPNCIRYINPPQDNEPASENDCFSVKDLLRIKDPKDFSDSLTVDTRLNSDVILTYRINSGAQNQVTIPVNSKLTRYELSY